MTGKWEDDKDAAKLLAEDGKGCMCLCMLDVHIASGDRDRVSCHF